MNSKNIQLKEVRILFPHLFHKKAFETGQEGKYSASFLIPKSSDLANEIIAEIKQLKNGLLKDAKIKKIKPNNMCLIDGDESEYETNHDHWILRSSNKAMPKVLNRKGEACGEDDIYIKGGDYVYALVSFWTYDNKWGKGISCNLHAIKFFKEGDGIGVVDNSKYSDEDFDPFDDSDTDVSDLDFD